ncbi:peptidoglycan D,D-transpeptidase FtsI family protein [Natronospira bacteriovora]|uniref:Peptidoglycan D,D-transpeptidase FtsI n=1 Tax=Natronospira bacteriovora TaxID=3069753 RepID=A0ABU0W6C1_9GAMM|nr:penicillin-binding transpeptidase domain-containing protein [Natronospira sp. AB-CW4]MDQ2069512.1 penicillin-binding transpeptidase domain-containing protein [Natronospira sp. AB-CW4]
MSKREQQEGRWRRGVVMTALALLLFALVGRAVELQVVDRDFLQSQGQARHLRVVEVPAHRGMVTDRHGEPMAVSTPVNSIWAHPGELLEAGERIEELAGALGLSSLQLRSRVEARQDREFVYLRRHLAPEEAEAILGLEIPGVYSQREYRRFYPAGEVAAHVLGFTNIDDRGQEGIELAFEGWLKGEPGAKRVLRDRLGRVIEDVENIRSPRPGKTLETSIDLRLQYVAYRELKAAMREHKAESGSIILMEPGSGEVLAMASQPGFNPNSRRGVTPSRMRNRAVVDLIEPGSTIKPFVVSAAFEAGQITADARFDTSPGRFRVAGHTVSDIRNYGELDITGVLQKSSNIGATKIALESDPETLWRGLGRLGIGQLTTSAFPGEAPGRLRHWSEWRQIGQVTASYGYGLSMSPLQLAAAYAALANGGVLPEVSLIRRDVTPPGEPIMQPETAAWLMEMLETVTLPGGTGTRAAVEGYRVAGKTGTVKKSGVGGYSDDHYQSVFVGAIPASRPRLVAVVVIDNPRGEDFYGGAVAAPVFGRVMADAMRLLDVPRDRVEPTRNSVVVRAGGTP